MRKLFWQAAAVVVIAALAGRVALAMTATDTVPASHAGQIVTAITPNTLKPAACNAITLTNLVVASGSTTTGTAANDLILGRNGNNTLGATLPLNGSDCCVGSAGHTNTYNTSCTVHTP